MGNENQNMPLLGKFSQIVLSPHLARGLLVVAILEALVAPFIGPRWALYGLATAACSLGVTSQLTSIGISWTWHYVRELSGQLGARQNRNDIPPEKLPVN